MSYAFPLAPIDLRLSFALQRFGRLDPSARLSADSFAKAWISGGTPTLVTMTREAEGRARVEGPDALVEEWLAALPDDGYDGFRPADRRIAVLRQRRRGLRLMPVPWMFDVACACVLQQRVRFADATKGFRRVVAAHGVDGPAGLRLFPPPSRLARLAPDALVALDIDPKRARTLVRLAREEVRDPFLSPATPRAELRRRLDAVRGIGPWTREMILLYGAGDPDAVPTGDLHMPHAVAWHFHRSPRGSDDAMLATLAPWAGQRGRILRLVVAGVRRPR